MRHRADITNRLHNDRERPCPIIRAKPRKNRSSTDIDQKSVVVFFPNHTAIMIHPTVIIIAKPSSATHLSPLCSRKQQDNEQGKCLVVLIILPQQEA